MELWNKEQEAIKVFHERLKFVGEKLKFLPQVKATLLNILEEAESCLCKVGQSPSQARYKAMKSLVSSLVKLELLQHQDV